MTDPNSQADPMAAARELRRQAKELKKQARQLETDAGGAGIVCPACGCRHFYTDKTLDVPGRRRRRYKTCRNCGRRVRTVEKIEVD